VADGWATITDSHDLTAFAEVRSSTMSEQFAEAGIKNVDDYLIPLTQRQHNSIMGKGVHTGPNNWNKQWGQFFKGTEEPSRDDVLRQLEKMRKEFCI
jgi:hypothetical protein